EHDNVAQRLEIVKLKVRVKKLEKTDKIKSSKFRRLRKDSEIAESEGRQADKQAEIYNIDLDHSLKVLIVAAYTRRRKGVIIRYLEKELSLKTSIETPAETPKVKDKGKGIMVEALKPMKKKDQIKMDAKYARKEEMEAEDQEIIKSINETPAQKAAKRKKLSEEAQEAEDLKNRLEVVEDEDDDVFVEATPLASKVPVVDYQIV
nr:hypothetical protein [Tanacetum cinerariifolium]